MHTFTEKVQTAITDFIAQRDALWLLISATAEDAPIVFKLLRECERDSRHEVFLLFGAPFVNAEQYAEQIVAQFVAEYRALDAARVAQHHAPLGSLPAALLSAQGVVMDPQQRIGAVIDAARTLLPNDGITRLVCAFWPMEVADPRVYERLLESLIPLSSEPTVDRTAGAPWKQVVRLIGREIKDRDQAPGPAWGGPYVLRVESDFSQAALLRSLQATSDDPHRPEAVRMHALFLQATFDQAQDRLGAAITKYSRALVYYQQQKNLNLQTVILLQLGEVYQRQHRLPEARACYEQALAPAAAVPVPLCAALLAKNLGEVAFAQQRYADAAIGYKIWHRIAGQLGDQEGVAVALTKLAAVQKYLGRATVDSPSTQLAAVGR